MTLNYYISKILKKIQISAVKNSKISKSSKVASQSHLVNVKMERYSYIGNNCTVLNTEIGSFCSIADNTIIGGASHPIQWVSTSPVFHEGKNILKRNFSKHKFSTSCKTIIGNDVWIGNNCLVKAGVNIGNGAIIGMGSILTKDVGPYEIWGGNPAKYIRHRIPIEKIEVLNSSQWWTWDEEIIEKFASNFNDVNKFVSEYLGEIE